MPENDEREEDPLQLANRGIRDAAKWLIASSAAVGAALLAGSQLSNIGKLDFGVRFTVALVGAIVGLVAVVWAIWIAVQLMIPETVTVDQLAADWKEKKRYKDAIEFFTAQPKYLQGFDTVEELINTRQGEVDELSALDGEDLETEAMRQEKKENIKEIDERALNVEAMAQTKTVEARFKKSLRLLLIAAAAAAVGIVAFAWASNPPPSSPAKEPAAVLKNAKLVNVYLRDANLKNAELDYADLRGADLTGAHMEGASVVGVKWGGTTCPDGMNSDAVGGSCAGHLSPAR
ncbi:pentapeptide repeat-containing protein [Streptomyces sp. NPDC001286]